MRLVLLLAALLLACPPAESPRERGEGVPDSAGRTIALDPEPERVLSLVPSMTELVVALGAAESLVGRTRFDTASEVSHLPSVGGATDASLEVVTALDPDLVIFWADEARPATARRIRNLGARVYMARIMTLDHYRDHARRLGRLLRAQGAADSLIRDLDRGLEEIRSGLPQDAPRPSVLYLTWHSPPSVAGPGTFVSEIVLAAGGRNVFADAGRTWPTVSMESVVAREPDWIVVPESGAAPWSGESFWGEEPWSSLRAVREGRVVTIPEALVGRPGPGNVRAAQILARRLHPEAFPE